MDNATETRSISCSVQERSFQALEVVDPVLVRTLLSTNKLPKSFTVSTEKNDELMQSVMLSDVYVVEKKRGFLRKCFDMFAAKERALAAELRQQQEEEEKKSAMPCGLCGRQKPLRAHIFLDVLEVQPPPVLIHVQQACGHHFCRQCLHDVLQVKIEQGTCLDMTCMQVGCQTPLSQLDLRMLLTPRELEAYLAKSFDEFVSANSDFTRCPNEQCGNVVQIIRGQDLPASQRDVHSSPLSTQARRHRDKHRFRCNKCETVFCVRCRTVPYHLGWTCKQFRVWQTAERCRYCGSLLPVSETEKDKEDWNLPSCPKHCGSRECIERSALSCQRVLPCGHACGGIRDEIKCLPCMQFECNCSTNQVATDLCSICYVDELGRAPCIRLTCGHIFHYTCVKKKLENGWPGSRITFGYMDCAICKCRMEHPALTATLSPALDLYEQVVEKAIQRLRLFSLEACDELSNKEGPFYGQPDKYALHRFSFYLCSRCKKPYFGGDKALCMAEENIREFDESELVCGTCSDFSAINACPEHGKEFIEYKCRYCCDVAVWFCWGTTHFCDACHKNAANLLTARKPDLPSCKCGFEHKPNGEEFAFCLLCRLAAKEEAAL